MVWGAIGLAIYPFRDKQFPEIAPLEQLIKVPAIRDQRIKDTTILKLNANVADQAIRRANVYGTIGPENAVLRVAWSMQDKDAEFPAIVRDKHRAENTFDACQVANYAIIIGAPLARKCSYAARALRRFDDKWLSFVNGTERQSYRECNYVCYDVNRIVGRRVPFDGVVSNERSRYPGLTDPLLDLVANGANHQNIYKIRAGLDQVTLAMRRILMRQTVQLLSATMSGPSSFSSASTLTWSVAVSGGSAPYTYEWSYRPSGSTTWTAFGNGTSTASRSVTSTTSSFTVRVVTKSSTGEYLELTKGVSKTTSGGGCVPQPGGSSCPQ